MIDRVVEIGALAGAFVAADRAGLLHRIVQAPASSAALAVAHGLHPEATEQVLDVLRAHGVIVREGELWRASDALVEALTGPYREPGAVSALFGRAERYLREGPPASLVPDDRGPVYAGAVSWLGDRFEPYARKLAARLAAAIPSGARILDVGAGSAVWSLALLARTDATLVVHDLPPVVPRALERARLLGLEARVTPLAGDWNEVAFEEQAFDVVVLANVLHMEPPPRARAMIARAARALRARGSLLVVDALSDGTPEQDRARSSYALHLAMRVPQAVPHDERELRAWLLEAGAGDVARIPVFGMLAALFTTR